MEHTNHPFRKENDLPNLHDYMFHVYLQGCRSKSQLSRLLTFQFVVVVVVVFFPQKCSLKPFQVKRGCFWLVVSLQKETRWWFQRFFSHYNVGKNHHFDEHIFFKWVGSTTN